MTEEEWSLAWSVVPLRDWLRARRNRDLRKERLFACACCRRYSDHLSDARSRAALATAESFADGLTNKKKLAAARIEATRASRAAAGASFGMNWRLEDAVQLLTNLSRDDVFLIAGNRLHIWVARLQLRTADDEKAEQAKLLRDVFGNPFRPVRFSPEWRTDTVVTLARQMYDARDFSAMPILADALQDAGCDNDDVLTHCRDANQTHVRGCWVCDFVLNKN
jgi:hypothetical protein